MKLSKESLHEILFEASMSIYDNAYKAGIALENDTLEIEGYERKDHLRDATKKVDGWTKLDPTEVRTYPPKGEEILAWGLPDPDSSEVPTHFVCWRSSFGFSCEASAYPKVHYWCPLPPPPGKEAKCG